MNNALLFDEMNCIPKPSVLSYDCPKSQRLLDLWDIINHFKAKLLCIGVANFANLDGLFKYGTDPSKLSKNVEHFANQRGIAATLSSYLTMPCSKRDKRSLCALRSLLQPCGPFRHSAAEFV